MADLFLNENGIPRRHSHVSAVDKIMDAKKKGDPWDVVDMLLDLWSKTAPDDVEAIGINIDEYRAGLEDKKFGTTKDGKDQDRRFMLSIPKKLIMMIRTQYSTEEFPFDKKFYKKFADKYPFFRVAERN